MPYRIKFGNSPIDVENGPTTDTYALSIENPIGTTVFGLAPAGNVTGSPLISGSRFNFGAATAEAYSASVTIGVGTTYHRIAGVSSVSATPTFTPSGAGNDGDILVIELVADASGTVTVTFAATFHSSGTQATTASHFSTIMFISDGTRWVEIARTTALA